MQLNQLHQKWEVNRIETISVAYLFLLHDFCPLFLLKQQFSHRNCLKWWLQLDFCDWVIAISDLCFLKSFKSELKSSTLALHYEKTWDPMQCLHTLTHPSLTQQWLRSVGQWGVQILSTVYLSPMSGGFLNANSWKYSHVSWLCHVRCDTQITN